MIPSFPLALLVVLLVSGCARSHDLVDPDAGVMRDSAAADAGFEAGECLLDSGLRRCDLDRCPIDETCGCHIIDFSEEGFGICVAPPGEAPEDCNNTTDPCLEGLCLDLGNTARHGPPAYGYCSTPRVCAEIVRIGDPAYCFYADGSVFEDGELARTPCREEEAGVLCGPACGGCAGSDVCLGVSEAHGLGVCVSLEHPALCGAGTLFCPIDDGCLKFVAGPDAIVPYESVAGACVPETRCMQVAASHPERFVCDPHG